MDTLLDKLRHELSQEQVLTGTDVSSRATHFWDASPLQAGALLRPRTTEQVSTILTLCHAAGQPVVTHGGVTGLVGGDRSTPQDLILSLELMRDIEDIDPVGKSMTVQAGCVLEVAQAAARDVGLQLGIDLGARGSCTIGGNMATNAGGLSVLRYGMTRAQILGLEVVLADGRIMTSMNRMLKNNAGFDLKHLFLGSEGVLGIITRAVLRLHPETPSRQTALLGFDHYQQVTDTLRHLDRALNGQLNAFEVMWEPFYKLATNAAIEGTVPPPLDAYPLYAIVESRGAHEDTDQDLFNRALEAALDKALISDAVIPQSLADTDRIWAIRENVELFLRHEPLFVYDVSLPVIDMQQWVTEVESQLRLEWPDLEFYAYGHLADGNLHVSVAPSPENYGLNQSRLQNSEKHANWHRLCNNIVYGRLPELGGSISAEHGIGIDKKPYLHLSRSSVELETMQQLKTLFDPNNILNPGKVI